MFYVYILTCNDNTLYTGSTNNIKKRILDHNTSKKGAHYTKIRRPVTLSYFETFTTKSEALKREAALKKINRVEKLKLITNFQKLTPAQM